MPLAPREMLPDAPALVLGKKYVIEAIERKFALKNGGEGMVVKTSEGLRRTTSKVIIGQLTNPKVTFPVIATVAEQKSQKTGRLFSILVE